MHEYLRNPLTYAWALLMAITLVSWTLGRGHGAEYHLSTAITVGVLGMSMFKALLVIAYFMEVRLAPVWLKRTTYGWAAALLASLLTAYFLGAG
ncbi:hypothetical protein E4634_00130 [Mangrovimicrobium sediminis]|uniref:Cytochrome C oxidase subunit IV n=1 Tax=Mangrovimicrobium sediminis TaxID=2562682 RepID=A0A4Z0M9C9_9GAMM|nr:cytochrome C oxidase subunit IV family protein [Haliea sp. SAOS-164]TGD75998.1 hypothetical protein E4634_00130 [Haliea sp. SAOS-164]